MAKDPTGALDKRKDSLSFDKKNQLQVPWDGAIARSDNKEEKVSLNYKGQNRKANKLNGTTGSR